MKFSEEHCKNIGKAKEGQIPWNYKGGYITGAGYIMLTGLKDWWRTYEKEHIYIYCKAHNLDKLPDGMTIHHIDHNKLNNSLDNLVMISREEHGRLHAVEYWKGVVR